MVAKSNIHVMSLVFSIRNLYLASLSLRASSARLRPLMSRTMKTMP
jgi:hypothetical protein